MFSKTVFLDITIYNTLPAAYIWKYFEILYMKGQDNLQNTSVNINHAQVNKIFAQIFGLNFHVITINHQKLWNLTISRQNWKN